MVDIGQKIDTSFSLDVVQNGEEKNLKFAELLTKPTIVSVYMKNNTPGCDKQNDSLAANADAIEAKGFNLVAISKDGCASHKKYADKKGISYILASDPNLAFAAATQSMVQKNMYGKVYEGPARAAFVINTDGTILAVIPKVNTKAHADELLKLLDTIEV
jgi:peroxiredoxin Q/BCP